MDSLLIYHVVDSYLRRSAFSITTLIKFLEGDINYLSVWQAEISTVEEQLLHNVLSEYSKKAIVFDALFKLNNNDTLYCSEFCATVLNFINSTRFPLEPRFMKLNNKLYEAILKRDSLLYFPVDFFECNPAFTKIYERHFKN